MKKRIVAVALALLGLGWWKVPDARKVLKPDVLYTWHTSDARRVDIAIQDGRLTLYVGDTNMETPYFQLAVQGDEIESFHEVSIPGQPASGFSGVNLDTKGKKVTKFIVTRTNPDGRRSFAKDKDGDLILENEN